MKVNVKVIVDDYCFEVNIKVDILHPLDLYSSTYLPLSVIQETIPLLIEG